MTRSIVLLLSLAALAVLAGCDLTDGGGESWGGYTEEEVREIIMRDEFRDNLLAIRPAGDETEQVLPTQEELEEADLRRVTLEGREAWEYKNAASTFCIYIWEESEEDARYATQVGPCNAD